MREGLRSAGLACALGLLVFTPAAVAAPGPAPAVDITIPNADFSDPANFGTIGGGLLGGGATNVSIGSGPWLGSYHSVLGLLVPPTLNISAGRARISGLAGVNLLGDLLNNGAYFSQTLAAEYQPEKLYTLSAEVDTGTPLGLSAINDGNLGIALTRDGHVVASTATAGPALIDLDLIGGTRYLLQLKYASGEAASGAIGVRLLSLPEGVLGAALLPSVEFRNVSLEAVDLNPTTGSVVAVGGATQETAVNTPFPMPLVVRVSDTNGDPLAGVQVTFAAPPSGASAIVAVANDVTDSNGEVSATATANTVAGSYTVTASVDGVVMPASFNLTNTAGPASTVVTASGGQQSTPIHTQFPAPLVVRVADEFGNPVPGSEVSFTAPASGASADLSAAMSTTDSNGFAQVIATANGTAGSYVVTGEVAGLATPAEFALTNLAGQADSIVATGGAEQTTPVNTAFPDALVVMVTDSKDNPVAGITVLFAAPGAGPSATLSSMTAPTDANGRASVTAVANPVAGNYDVVASVGGVAVPASFHLTNTAGPPSQVVAMGGAIQSTEVGTAFADPLVVRVSDSGGNPVADVAVEFSAPASGAGATITPPSAITDANGEARVDATANTVAGSYAVAADVAGVATGAEFQLTNTAGPPAEIAISGGDDQSAVVNTPFASPLSVLVSDAFGNPVGNVDVEFAVPASGASASLSGNLTTGADGIAEVIATANSAVGSYVVTASVASIGGSGAEFHLTNVLGDGVVIGDISGDDQNAQIDTAFRCALAVQVTDSGLPQGGLTIEFEAPAAGASSILSDGVSTGTTVQAVTGLNGVALVEATANGIAGSYDVTATLLGSGQPPVVFHLTNLVDLLFANGFEGNCILVP